jgi:cyclophilin family peptidyl-prolyl cis-trans isomerase/HEAT repeat protein
MQATNFRNAVYAGFLVVASITTAAGQKRPRADSATAIPAQTMLRILRAEDQRRWNSNLSMLLNAAQPTVRKRAALALGRIGDERALPALIESLKSDRDNHVRQMCAFAIGEIESPAGADTLIAVLDNTRGPAEVRARAVEALGKIGAVLLSNAPAAGAQAASPPVEDKTLTKIKLAILDALRFESGRRAAPDRATILLALTAALRVRADAAGPIIVKFLGHSDPRIVADALNAMARLRLKDNNEEVRQLLNNGDAIVRANAARVIGAAEDKGAFDPLLTRALTDNDLRVRASAIRALGSLKDQRAAVRLIQRGRVLQAMAKFGEANRPAEKNELLEIATTLGRLIPNSNQDAAIKLLRDLRVPTLTGPEVEIAFARIAPEAYLNEQPWPRLLDEKWSLDSWGQQSSLAQALREIANIKLSSTEATEQLHNNGMALARVLGCFEVSSLTGECDTKTLAVPDTLRAYAAFKPADLRTVLHEQFEMLTRKSRVRPLGIFARTDSNGNYQVPADVIARATAADLLGELPPDTATTGILAHALPIARHDELNDAVLSILDALAKQKSAAANDAIKTALGSPDYLVRRRAVSLLKENGAGDFSSRIGTVKTRNKDVDYRRAIARAGRKVTVTIVTSRGAFTIEFLPEEAPLTVDNFIKLARVGYFDGQTIPRVVSNFVIQAGDPRGDQNGGPGYQIRCEINEAPFERAAVGMALSGKDTGGSQWFVTHSPQPHLDGGYTVFGRVISGMDVVDKIVRGDTIRRVIVNGR